MIASWTNDVAIINVRGEDLRNFNADKSEANFELNNSVLNNKGHILRVMDTLI